MAGVLNALLAAVMLGGGFGTATATVESAEDSVVFISIEVEVLDTADSVVAHLSFDDEEFTLPLVDRGDGTFGTRIDLEPKNYIVVFEVLGGDGAVSEPTTLVRMGADLGSQAGGATNTTESDEEGLGPDSERLLWLAIALGAASLSLIAFWVLGSRHSDEENDSTTGGSDEENDSTTGGSDEEE